jgi:methylglyoxal synthase
MKDNIRKLERRKKIALIAHDNKKKDLIEWENSMKGNIKVKRLINQSVSE